MKYQIGLLVSLLVILPGCKQRTDTSEAKTIHTDSPRRDDKSDFMFEVTGSCDFGESYTEALGKKCTFSRYQCNVDSILHPDICRDQAKNSGNGKFIEMDVATFDREFQSVARDLVSIGAATLQLKRYAEQVTAVKAAYLKNGNPVLGGQLMVAEERLAAASNDLELIRQWYYFLPTNLNLDFRRSDVTAQTDTEKNLAELMATWRPYIAKSHIVFDRFRDNQLQAKKEKEEKEAAEAYYKKFPQTCSYHCKINKVVRCDLPARSPEYNPGPKTDTGTGDTQYFPCSSSNPNECRTAIANSRSCSGGELVKGAMVPGHVRCINNRPNGVQGETGYPYWYEQSVGFEMGSCASNQPRR